MDKLRAPECGWFANVAHQPILYFYYSNTKSEFYMCKPGVMSFSCNSAQITYPSRFGKKPRFWPVSLEQGFVNSAKKGFLPKWKIIICNGPVLGLVRVSAAFHCPPLNNFTKIKLSHQTTKPPHWTWTRVISWALVIMLVNLVYIYPWNAKN